MIIINVGNFGYPTEDRAKNYTEYGFPPFFKPDGFVNTTQYTDESRYGISGGPGRFLSVWTSITLAVFACMGGDIVIVTAGEARSPRKDLPGAAQFMYLAPIGFYILGSFLVGFNVNYSTPDLFHPWAGSKGDRFPSHSPFIIAIRNSSLGPKTLPILYNALFLFAAYTAANTALFSSSRTLFALSKTFGNRFLNDTVGKTNSGHTPLAAIICCSLFGLLAFLGLADDSFNQPVLSMSSFFTGSIACVYGAECIAFLRFKKGLTALEERGMYSRDSESYRKQFYRAHWQPLWAILGLVGCSLIMIFTPWAALYIMSNRRNLADGANLKPNHLLAWDLVGAYSGPVLFFLLYFGFKVYYGTSIQRPEDYRHAYRLPDIDRLEPEPASNQLKDWRYWIKEVWSYIK